MQDSTNGDIAEQQRRELRFALVLYGGVSLCIYMHGTTKEIDRLVGASAALATGAPDTQAEQTAPDAPSAPPSERVYRELLDWLATRDGVRTDVSVDVIAGTSAGGINGVYLAKALARNLSQDNLRDLWLQEGDLNGLLLGPSFLNWRLRIPGVLARLPRKPALDGTKMARLLFKALGEMDDRGRRSKLATLMPPESSMDLMVTMTDFYGYDRQVAIRSPELVHDEQHRHVLRFSQADEEDRYARADNLALAFAARATSCFPGAFEPVSPSALCGWVGQPGPIGDEFFRLYRLSGADPHQTRFVDGGVLDNRPFAPAIEAMRRKPAHSEVERWVLYLDPDPAPVSQAERRSGPPRPLETIAGAIAGLPRKQPILDSLLEIQALNARVRELRDVIEQSFDDVRDEVVELAGDVLDAPPDPATLLARDRLLAERARGLLGIGYPTYLRARIASTLDSLAAAVCALCGYPPESNHAMLTHAIWRAWAETTDLFAQTVETHGAQVELLDSLDVELARRRVRFTLAGVNWLYEPPDADPGAPASAARSWPAPEERERLDGGKAGLWDALGQLERLLATAFEHHADAVRACFAEQAMSSHLKAHGLEPGPWLDAHAEQLQALVESLRAFVAPRLEELLPEIYGLVLSLGGERTDIHVRYLGFALFDAYLYPIEYGAGVCERDRIDVMRLSPLECDLLRWPAPKVQGTRYGHFGAFMRRDWRESDYLAGRLDGAERMISLLIGDPKQEAARRRWCRRAFEAILEEERGALQTAGALIGDLSRQIAGLEHEPPTPGPPTT